MVPDELTSHSEVHIRQGHLNRIFGGCARKVVGLTPGDLCCVPQSGLRRCGNRLTAAQKSADGIVPGDGQGRPER